MRMLTKATITETVAALFFSLLNVWFVFIVYVPVPCSRALLCQICHSFPVLRLARSQMIPAPNSTVGICVMKH